MSGSTYFSDNGRELVRILWLAFTEFIVDTLGGRVCYVTRVLHDAVPPRIRSSEGDSEDGQSAIHLTEVDQKEDLLLSTAELADPLPGLVYVHNL